MAMLVTQLAAAVAALAWVFAEWAVKGKPSVLGAISGAVAGLVAITPAAGFVLPVPALIIGVADVAGKYYVPQVGAFLIYVLMIVILVLRPQGLLARGR